MEQEVGIYWKKWPKKNILYWALKKSIRRKILSCNFICNDNPVVLNKGPNEYEGFDFWCFELFIWCRWITWYQPINHVWYVLFPAYSGVLPYVVLHLCCKYACNGGEWTILFIFFKLIYNIIHMNFAVIKIERFFWIKTII